MDKGQWPDRRRRHRVQIEAQVVPADGPGLATIVSDLSLEGCRVAGHFRIGDAIDLNIPEIGLVRGQVRWAINGRAGVRFLTADGTAAKAEAASEA